MRRKTTVHFILLFILLYFANFNHIYAGTKKENFKKENHENQQVENKERKYKWEFSASVSLYYEPEDVIKDTLMISIPVRIGYFLTRNIEIESELNFMLESSESTLNSETKTLFLINLAYNFNTSSHLMPFLLLGAGVISYPPEAWIPIIEPTNISSSALDAGVGIKWFVVKKVAMRIEYRFISYDRGDINRHNIFMGISIFF